MGFARKQKTLLLTTTLASKAVSFSCVGSTHHPKSLSSVQVLTPVAMNGDRALTAAEY